MKRRKPMQKEEETQYVFNKWFEYVEQSTMPFVDEFAIDFLGISRTTLSNLRKKGKLPEEDIALKNGKILHPRTFKELFSFDVDSCVKEIKMPDVFDGEPKIVELYIELPKEHFFCSVCPRLKNFRNTLVSLDEAKTYGLPTIKDIQQLGAFFPASPISYGISCRAYDLIEQLENKQQKAKECRFCGSYMPYDYEFCPGCKLNQNEVLSFNVKTTPYLKKLFIAFFTFCGLATILSIITNWGH